MKKQKGVTLLELLLGMIIIIFMCATFGSVHLLLTRAYRSMEQELGEFSATGSNALEFMCQRIMRADITEVQDTTGGTLTGRTLWVNMPLATPSQGTLTLVGDELRYFPGVHILAAQAPARIANSQLLARNVRNVAFAHDHQSQIQYVVGNPHQDGIGAPVFFITYRSPPRVGMTLALGDAAQTITMQTAAVPRISPEEQQTVRWISPVIKGNLLEVKELERKCYALVKADAIAMHTSAGFQSLDGQLFYVEIPLNLGRALESKIGEQIAFMGDILINVEGKPAMVMNSFYGGGVLVGKDAVEAMCRKIEAGEETWYKTESLRLKGALEEAKKTGTDISDWQEVWRHLQRYYEL